MAEPKPFSPYEEQLSILRGRGLAIPDEELALQWLREKNYYRLSAYSLTLRQRDTATGNDKFFDGASFSDIIDLHARQYGPIGYLDGNNFEDPWRHAKFLNALSKSLNLRKDEPFVLHHHNDLNGIYPLWVVVEVLSFDQISMLYRNLSKSDRAAIAREFYSIPSREYIENWIHCSVVARNIAAHGARFYHRKRVNPPAKLPKEINEYGTKPFGYVYALYQLLPQNERFTFASCIQVCFAEHPSAKPSELGFPSNWHELIK